MSVNVARYKSKPFSHLPLTIIWPSPLECTHTRGVFSIIRPSPLKLSGPECWVLLPRNYTSLTPSDTAWPANTHKLSIRPPYPTHTHDSICTRNVDCICMFLFATGWIIPTMRRGDHVIFNSESADHRCLTHTCILYLAGMLLHSYRRNTDWEIEAGGGPICGP